MTIEENHKSVSWKRASPLEVLRGILKEYRSPRIEGMPPFTGGFVGYFAYSMIGYAEPVLSISGGDFDDYDLMLFDRVIAYDHLRQKICLVVNMKTDKVLENYGKAAHSWKPWQGSSRRNAPLPVLTTDSQVVSHAVCPRKNIAGWWRRRRNTSGRAIFSRQSFPDSLPAPTRVAC